MELFLHRTKLQLPLIAPKSYYSKRLQDLAIADNRLSILLAPSGFGKTTAVLLSLAAWRDRTRWYRLEQEDSFVDIFYQHVITMLFFDEPQLMQDQLKLLHSLQDLSQEYAILNAQICQDLAYLHASDTEPLFLVFDDFQWLAGKEIFTQIFRYFVRNLPECVRLILTSRTDPYLITGRLCLNSQCRQYSFEELLFDPSEVKELIQEVYLLPFSPEQISYIQERSKGWAAGIYLLSHTLASQPSLHDPAQHADELSSFFSHYFQEYLLSMEESKKTRLMELALLDDFSLDELTELFGQENPTEFLHWLASNQLCFQTTADGKTIYYFHSLLSDELRSLYQSTHAKADQQAQYRKIGDYYLADNLEKALSFYLQAGDEAHALSIAAARARDYFDEGRPEAFFPILSLFQAEQVSQNPYLLLMKGMRALNLNQLDAQNCFLQALDSFRKQRDDSFLMNSFGMLLVVAYQLNNFDPLEEASKKLPLSRLILFGGPARTKLIISYFIERVGRDQIKHIALLQRYLDKKKPKEELWQFSYLMIRGIYFYRIGDLQNSRKNLERILAHPVLHSDDQWRIIGLVSCCNLAFLQADLELIQYFVNQFTLLAERLNASFALGYAHYLRGFLYYLQGQQPAAAASMELAKEAFLAFGSDLVTLEAECYTYLMTDTFSDEAIQRTQAIYEHMTRQQPSHGMAEFTLGVMGILLKRADRYEEARRALLESLAISSQKGAMQSVHALHLQLADTYLREGKATEGLAHFEQWVTLGKAHGYLYGRKFTHQVLDSVRSHLPEQWLASPYSQAVSRFYIEAKRRSQKETVIKLQLFGPFSLEVDSTRLSEKDFKTRKVSGLL